MLGAGFVWGWCTPAQALGCGAVGVVCRTLPVLRPIWRQSVSRRAGCGVVCDGCVAALAAGAKSPRWRSAAQAMRRAPGWAAATKPLITSPTTMMAGLARPAA